MISGRPFPFGVSSHLGESCPVCHSRVRGSRKSHSMVKKTNAFLPLYPRARVTNRTIRTRWRAILSRSLQRRCRFLDFLHFILSPSSLRYGGLVEKVIKERID